MDLRNLLIMKLITISAKFITLQIVTNFKYEFLKFVKRAISIYDMSQIEYLFEFAQSGPNSTYSISRSILPLKYEFRDGRLFRLN